MCLISSTTTTLVVILAVLAVATSLVSANNSDKKQVPRQITASDFAKIHSLQLLSGEGEEQEQGGSALKPWIVHFSLPWANASSSNFHKAAARLPSSIIRFAELVVDTPEALALADLFQLRLPGVLVVNGQQSRHEQMLSIGGLPFTDTPVDVRTPPQNTFPLERAQTATVAEFLQFVAKLVPQTVFSQLDRTEMLSAIKISHSLSETVPMMKDAGQKSATLIAVQSVLAGGGGGAGGTKKVKAGRELVQLATLSVGAQFVGRDGGMVFFVDTTTLNAEEDEKVKREFALSDDMLNGKCQQDENEREEEEKDSACFDVIKLTLTPNVAGEVEASNVFGNKGQKDLDSIYKGVHDLVVASSSSTSSWKDYLTSEVTNKHDAARSRYARVFDHLVPHDHHSGSPPPASSSKKKQQDEKEKERIEKDIAIPLLSTEQFHTELTQSRGGLMLVAFVRPSDRNYERHLKAVNELAARLYKNRIASPPQAVQQGAGQEMRFEVFTIDTDRFPGAAEGFNAVQVPSIFVLHHLENNQHAVAQFRGEFSTEEKKLREMEKFAREKCFDQQAVTPIKIDKVNFEAKRKQSSSKKNQQDQEAVNPNDFNRNSFNVPYQKLLGQSELKKFMIKLDGFTFVSSGGSASSSSSSGKKKGGGGDNSKNSKKNKKETPEEEAKRLKQEAAKNRKDQENKKKLEEEIAKKKKAKEDRIRQKQEALEAAKKKKEAEKQEKLQQIREEVNSGKRVKKITREDMRSKRDAILKKSKPKPFNIYRQERQESLLRKEVGFVGEAFTQGDHNSQNVKILDLIW